MQIMQRTTVVRPLYALIQEAQLPRRNSASAQLRMSIYAA